MNAKEKGYAAISEYLTKLAMSVSQDKGANRHDTAVGAETFYAEYLNILFGWKLKNVNAEQTNAKGIDLCDLENKIIVQVSSGLTREKIDHTLKMLDGGNYGGYHLCFMGITVRFTPSKKAFSIPPDIIFQPEKDIIDHCELLNRTYNAEIDVISALTALVGKYEGRTQPELRLLRVLDSEFDDLYRYSPAEIRSQEFNYYNVSKDIDTILCVVKNGLHEQGSDYSRLVKQIMHTALSDRNPVFLVGDGGSGKSTLLLSAAVAASEEESVRSVVWSVASSNDSMKETLFQELDWLAAQYSDQTVLLCIDGVADNIDQFHAFYEKVTARDRAGKFSNWHIAVSERMERVYYQILSKGSPHDFSRWSAHASAILLTYSDGASNSDYDLLGTIFRKDHIFVEHLEETSIQLICRKQIRKFSEFHALDADCAAEAMSRLNFRSKSIVDIFRDFRRRYNILAERHALASEKTAMRIDADWDVWKRKFRDLDPFCSGRQISGIFGYIAALSLFNIPVTLSLLEHMTGYHNLQELRVRLALNEPVRLSQDILNLRHDTVADNYFAENAFTSLQQCLLDLINYDLLDANTIIAFEKIVFSLSRIAMPKLTDRVDLSELLRRFKNNGRYVRVLEENFRIHSLELAVILDAASRYENSPEQYARYTRQAMDSSFQRYLPLLLTAPSDRYFRAMWQNYFLFALRTCDELPVSMINVLEAKTNTYKIITAILENIKEHIKLSNYLSNEKFSAFSCVLYEKMLAINPDDIVAHYDCANVMTELHRFSDAQGILLGGIQNPAFEASRNKLYMALYKAYEKELRFLFSRLYEKKYETQIEREKIYERIDVIQTELDRINATLFQSVSEDDEIYYPFIRRYARREIKRKNCKLAYELLSSLSEYNPAAYQKHVELGYLYNRRSSEYYDLDRSIAELTRGWEMCPQSKSEAIHILIPLGKTYFFNNQIPKALEIFNHKDIRRRPDVLKFLIYQTNQLYLGGNYRTVIEICSSILQGNNTKRVRELLSQLRALQQSAAEALQMDITDKAQA